MGRARVRSEIGRHCQAGGVSRSTVSRVVNDQPYVRPAVRERVLKVIQETGFHPNVAARTLASQRSWMIGLVLPRSVSSLFSDPYFPRLTQGIAQACNQYNYTLALFLVDTNEDEQKIYHAFPAKACWMASWCSPAKSVTSSSSGWPT